MARKRLSFRVKVPDKASKFVECMNNCGRQIEITPTLAERILIQQDPPIIAPDIYITCCECAFGITSEQLLQEH